MKPLTVQHYMIEPARGITRESGLSLTTVVLLRIKTAESGELAYVLSPVDAMQISTLLSDAAMAAQNDAKIIT